MFVSGFTIVRNAVKFDYPVTEAIRSILPLCDEMVVAVGNSEDDTLNLIRNIGSPKIRIIETVWDDSMREGGRVLALETDKAYAAISEKADWCFYIQADEVIHEKDHEAIRKSMQQWKDKSEVEGLLFDYVHFYGSYDYTGNSRRWYRNEIRIVRRLPEIRSYRDAQGFRKTDNSKLRVKKCGASVHHYGWVKPPEKQQAKQESFHKMWHDDAWMEKHIPKTTAFDYSGIDSLARFTGTHPAVMQDRIKAKKWTFEFDPSQQKLSFKSRFSMWVEHTTGYRIGEYKNYILI